MKMVDLAGLRERLGRNSLSMLSAIVIAATAAVAVPASAATTLFEDFSTGFNGWSSTGSVSLIVPGGGPAGASDPYLLTTDAVNTAMVAMAGNGWSGDLSAYNNGTLSFDFIHLGQVEPTLIGSFGRVTITHGGGTAMGDAYAGGPMATWTTAMLGFNAQTFNRTPEQWAAILSNVTSISIQLESWGGISESVGLDNVQLSAVPLPASALLLLAGLGGLVVMRRRSAAA